MLVFAIPGIYEGQGSLLSLLICLQPLTALNLLRSYRHTMSTKTTDDTKDCQSPQAGSPCWVEIPARDSERLKVGSQRYGGSVNLLGLALRVLDNCWIPLTISSRQAFYGAIFPSWEWKSANVESPEGQKKVQLFSFTEPKGESIVDAWLSLSTSLHVSSI